MIGSSHSSQEFAGDDGPGSLPGIPMPGSPLPGIPMPGAVHRSPSESPLPPVVDPPTEAAESWTAGGGEMIAASPDESSTATQVRSEPRVYSGQAELYAELFGVAPSPRSKSIGSPAHNRLKQVQAPPPKSPRTLAESGLTASQVCELILKQLYLHGTLMGVDIARNARLPFNAIDECLRFLKDDHSVEVTSGDVIGRVSYRFHLTEGGRTRAKEAFDFCRYVGPAPVPLSLYVEQCRRQAVSGINCTPETLTEAFEELIIEPDLLTELGPAVCSGKSIFLYGPPGNGKSQISKGIGRFLNLHGGEIYVPYAIQTENNIITVFDPSLHHTVDDEELTTLLGSDKGNSKSDAHSPQSINRLLHEDHPDLRWRRVRRPIVVTGGELTLDMLDLRFNKLSNFYVAPLQLKANGGVFMIDDFGRQLVSPRDLLNRWILPLEDRIDYVTLATGKKFPVPFEQLVIFSTNLNPSDLCDDAFLRRIRHKVKIDSPSRELYTEIFSLCCEQRQIPFEPRAVDLLYDSHYDRGRQPRSSDPRDLLEIIQAICRFRNQRLILTQDLMSEATQRFFSELSDAA
ncbi:MAG: ATPase [Planctomycetota bacterium]|nr:ATPase [Planctomycetota bacterium]MDA1248313.1 ATPase [Planctomycetota bacterium]